MKFIVCIGIVPLVHTAVTCISFIIGFIGNVKDKIDKNDEYQASFESIFKELEELRADIGNGTNIKTQEKKKKTSQ